MIVISLPVASCAFDYATTFSVVKDVVVVLGTIFAIGSGIRGFSQWREIEWSKADFDLSRRLLTAVFTTRDWLIDARRWAVFEHEYPAEYVKADATTAQKRDAYSHMFSNRFKPVRNSAIALQSLRPEAEALWGPDIAKLTGDLLACCHKLDTSMSIYVRLLGTTDPRSGANGELQFEQVVYDIPKSLDVHNMTLEENDFSKEIRLAVEAIDKYVRAKQKPVKRGRP